jgi:hypothetical protein
MSLPTPVELLAGEIASDVFPWVPEQTLDKLAAIRKVVQQRLECNQGIDYMRRIIVAHDAQANL